MEVYGHALVWGAHAPAWFNASLSRDDGQSALRDAARFLLNRWQRVWAWNVVMEPFGDPHWAQPLLKDNSFLRVLGEGYIDAAFHAARDANPAPKRCLLDYKVAFGMYPGMSPGAWDSRKANRTFSYVQGMVSRGVPINCVAMEGHIAPKTRAGPQHRAWLARNMQRYAPLGVDVHLNAVTVSTAAFPAEWGDDERLDAQAGWYAAMLGACVDAPACALFETYGVTDRYDMGGDAARSLPFDADYAPKPAFWAMVGVLNWTAPAHH